MLRVRYLLLLALGLSLLSGFAQVRPEERAVVRRFGRVVARPGPGLWVGLPWGIDQLDRVQVRTVRQLRAGFVPETTADTPETPPGQLLTGDQNLVNVQLVLDYAIGENDSDLDDFVMQRDVVDASLAREMEAEAAEWASGRGVEDVLLTGNAAIPVWILDRLPARAAALRLGIRVQRVSVALLAPPDEVRSAFEQVTQAQTGIRTRENQARQEADLRMRQAEALRYKLGEEAGVFREGQVRQARADAAECLAQLATYRELQKLYPDALAIIWWDEIRKTLVDMKARGGRIDPLDAHMGRDGLDVTQVVSPKRK